MTRAGVDAAGAVQLRQPKVARTATINRIRGLLSELGIVLPLKAEVVRREARNHFEDLPGYANTVICDLLSEVRPWLGAIH